MEMILRLLFIWSLLLYLLLTVTTLIPERAFDTKGTDNDGRNPPSCLSVTLFPKAPYINKEAINCISEGAIGAVNPTAISAIKDLVFLYKVLLFEFCSIIMSF